MTNVSHTTSQAPYNSVVHSEQTEGQRLALGHKQIWCVALLKGEPIIVLEMGK